MVVDMARTCFTQLMQFDEAGDYIAPVRFYFAVPGAKIFPGAHLFGTDYFLSHVDCDVGPGLYWNDVRTYDKGAPPPGISGQGPPCGPLDWWMNGVPSDAPPLDLDNLGRPICCHPSNSGLAPVGTVIGLSNILCQPWHVFGPPARIMKDVTAGVTWTSVTQTTLAGQWKNPSFPTDLINASEVGQTCGGFNKTLSVRVTPSGHPTQVCTLLTWDPVAKAGLWQAPATTFRYPLHYFRFTNPT